MGLMQYLLDTNIVIYYFNGLTNDERMDALLTNSFNISIITQMEFLGWSEFAIDKHLYQKAQEFISHANVIGLGQGIVEKTIVLRQQHRIKMPDAIIAATALVNDLGIATNNIDDFKRLDVETLQINVLLA
jgi:predicted nucleic acid-binding protein